MLLILKHGDMVERREINVYTLTTYYMLHPTHLKLAIFISGVCNGFTKEFN